MITHSHSLTHTHTHSHTQTHSAEQDPFFKPTKNEEQVQAQWPRDQRACVLGYLLGLVSPKNRNPNPSPNQNTNTKHKHESQNPTRKTKHPNTN